MAFYQNLNKLSLSMTDPHGGMLGRYSQYDWFESNDSFYDAFCYKGGLTKFEKKEDLVPRPKKIDHDYPYKVRENYLQTLKRDQLDVIAKGLKVELRDKEHRDDLIARIIRRW